MKHLFHGLLLTLASLAPAAEPPTAPILRIEAGMHTARIYRIATDAAGRIVLTVSDDKTARLWELPSGRLLRVLRPPVGAGSVGKLYAGALSPDGKVAALGGDISNESGNTESVHLFDTSTGRLMKRLSEIPNAIADLAFSPSGNRLAAGLIGKSGVRVWRVSTGQLLGQGTGYGDACYGLDWNGESRLVTSSDDGKVRLHEVGDARLRLVTSVATKAGKHPFAVRFRPDGGRVAIGFEDAAAIEVRDGRDLSLLFSPNAAGITNGNLGRVAWTADGQTLAAAGDWRNAKGSMPIRIWSNGGKGPYHDLPASQQTIIDLRPVPGGGFLFAATDPAWGRVSHGTSASKFQVQVPGVSPIADFGSNAGGFLVSADGTGVAFGFQVFGRVPAAFSIPERNLREGQPKESAIGKAPRTEGLPITDWKNNYAPKLHDQLLPMDPYERSFSLAIAPDVSYFALGAEWHLRNFSAEGKVRWQVPAPEAVWGVNITADGRLIVAAYGDGTIRWHRADTGRELLAFFPHADRKRWVLWTPEGYYDCSPGSEDLIGWHVNRGKDEAADFFPAAKFRDQFFRPDIIQKVLPEGDVSRAVALANLESGRKVAAPRSIKEVMAGLQPPVVELLVGGANATLETASETVTLKYRVRQGGSPLSHLKLMVDGRPVEATIPIPASDTAEASFIFVLPKQECVLVLLAENNSAVSEPARLRVTRGATQAPVTELAAALKPKLYLLAVGVSDYAKNNHLEDLRYAAKDAADFAGVFEKQDGILYEKVEVKLLTNEKATAGEVLDGLDWIKKETTTKDVAIVFFSGHGENDEELRYYFCPHDYDHTRRLRTGVAMEEIQKTLAAVPGKVLFFIDSCHAGNALGKLFAAKGKGAQVDITRLVNELSSAENGAVVFASSTGRQLSVESEEWKNGAFTKAIVEGMNGKADLLRHGKVTVSGLEAWVAERVKELSEGTQTPTVAKPQTVPDFPIGVLLR